MASCGPARPASRASVPPRGPVNDGGRSEGSADAFVRSVPAPALVGSVPARSAREPIEPPKTTVPDLVLTAGEVADAGFSVAAGALFRVAGPDPPRGRSALRRGADRERGAVLEGSLPGLLPVVRPGEPAGWRELGGVAWDSGLGLPSGAVASDSGLGADDSGATSNEPTARPAMLRSSFIPMATM